MLRLGPRLQRLLGVLRGLPLFERMRARLELARLRERQHLDDSLALLAGVALDRGEAAVVPGLHDRHAHRKRAAPEVRRRIAQQLERVERPIPGVAAVRFVPLPRGDRQYVGPDPRRDPHRRAHGAVRRLEKQDVPVCELPFRRRLGMHLDPRVPGDLRNRVRELLQPRFVGTPAVVPRERREDDQQRFPGCPRSGAGHLTQQLRDPGVEPHRLGGRFGVQPAVLQGVSPEVREIPPLADALVQLLPAILEIVLERPRLPRHAQQRVPRVHGVGEHGLHHRLL